MSFEKKVPLARKIFEDYASLYDDIYMKKNYAEECKFIKKIFKKFSDKKVKSILDLGCGTGTHASYLTNMGFEVTGVDISAKMLNIANIRRIKNAEFIQADIRNFNLNKKYDVALAMFAVFGYLIENREIESALKCVNNHLCEKGLFVFDVWHGPAVLMQKPEERIKIIEKNNKKIIKCASPTLNVAKSYVKINYRIFEIKKGNILRDVKESHFMRFFFCEEIKYLLKKNGFKVLHICTFMKLNSIPTKRDWNITIICRKVKK